jgi:signal transduction histidine kinase
MRGGLARFVTLAALAAAYTLAGRLGLSLAFLHASASPVWPPTGIALAAFLMLGHGVWPAIFVGAFVVNVTTAGSAAISLGIATGNTLEGLAGAWLVNRYAGGRDAFEQPQSIFKFAVLAGMLSTTVSATLGVASLRLGGLAEAADMGSIWLTWWLGDMAGALVVAPLLLLWGTKPPARWGGKRGIEVGLLRASVCLLGMLVFGGWFPARSKTYPLEFLCVPLVVWAAFRFGRREAATAAFILSAIAIWGTLQGFGPFVGETQNESLLLLQTYMAVTAITGISVAAVVSEARRRRNELRVLNEELERRVAERTREVEAANAELSRSNVELERFAYTASHDLQEPLRMVASFTELLAQRYKGRLDAEADEFIGFAQEGAERMQALIEGLLAYSRVGSGGRPLKRTDCNAVLRAAVSDLGASLEETGGSVTWDPLPEVQADPVLIRQLFQNLVSNALRFRSQAAPRVHVCAEREGDEWIFSVRDNGIGIAAEHAGRIFQMFQRLHPRSEYPGSGIGLAICKKIVERYGGRIWVEPAPQGGSVFRFALPGRRAAEAATGPS